MSRPNGFIGWRAANQPKRHVQLSFN